MQKPRKTKVLFVCVGNSCRSQMAEAFARHRHADLFEASSAGISPLGRIADATRQVMAEKGILLEGQYSKGLPANPAEFDGLLINMTGIPGPSLFAGARVVDWDVDDPFGEDLSVHRRVRDEIERLVETLASELRKQREGDSEAAVR